MLLFIDLQKPAPALQELSISRSDQKLMDVHPHIPDGVLEAVVRSPGEHQVSPSQLLDVPQPLKLRRVYEPHQQRMQLNVAVDGVIEDLQHKHITFGNVWHKH